MDVRRDILIRAAACRRVPPRAAACRRVPPRVPARLTGPAPGAGAASARESVRVLAPFGSRYGAVDSPCFDDLIGRAR